MTLTLLEYETLWF